MQNLIDFFEKETNKKIKIFEYNNEELKNNQNLVTFNNINYIVEFINNINVDNISGHSYLFYQQDLDFDSLKDILYNLYEDVEIVHYDRYLLLVSKNELDINSSTLDIIETETYRKTYIVYLNKIENKEFLNFNINIVNELLPIVIKDNNTHKVLNLHDLIIYKTIYLCNNDNFLFHLVDFDIIKNMDDSVLLTGLNFIENGLNISKTSSALFLHRNTLVYRLDKIKELLNLDLKNFKDAFVFYLSVKSYFYF
ncbi:MAG: PucR family transcriptional regulator [Peptostreptococcaceae bacterium]